MRIRVPGSSPPRWLCWVRAPCPRPPDQPNRAATQAVTAEKRVVGYFTEWGVYDRNYHVKNIKTSGSASKLTTIVYAFGNTTGGRCAIGDSYAAYDKFYDAASSVDGVADTWDTGALRGNFNQLRKLKREFPNIKVVWSFGGWTWSGGSPRPRRTRPRSPTPARAGRGPALGRRVRRDRHRLGVPERLRPEL